jgi:hypothetical protein
VSLPQVLLTQVQLPQGGPVTVGGHAMGVFATDVEDAVVAFFNPELVESSGGSQTAGAWPLVSLPQAASVALVYLGLVAVGSRVMACRPAMCGAGIKRMMVVYNAVQVVLCLYMAGETVRQYWILGYRPLCNNPLVQVAGQPFDPTGMSDVLWVFYLSKVLPEATTLLGCGAGPGRKYLPRLIAVGCRCWTFVTLLSSCCARRIGSSGLTPLLVLGFWLPTRPCSCSGLRCVPRCTAHVADDNQCLPRAVFCTSSITLQFFWSTGS